MQLMKLVSLNPKRFDKRDLEVLMFEYQQYLGACAQAGKLMQSKSFSEWLETEI